jgi:tetratricopeptide (TPR) repeat protein
MNTYKRNRAPILLIAALLSLLAIPAHAPAWDSVHLTESHTHKMEKMDTEETASAIAHGKAVERLLKKAAAKLGASGLLSEKEAKLTGLLMPGAVLVSTDGIKCGNGSCTAKVSASLNVELAARTVRAMAGAPKSRKSFRSAEREQGEALGAAEKAASREDYARLVLRAYSWHWFFTGSLLTSRGQHFDAVEALTRFIALRPGFASAHMTRGASYSALRRHQEAIRDYDAAVGIDPGNPGAYNNRGVAHYNLGDMRRAVLDFTRAIERDNHFAEAYLNRGNAYLDWGKTSDAVADYSRAIELRPGYAEAYNSRGTAYNSMGKPGAALGDFERAVELDPSYPDAYNNRGVAYHRKGMLKEAFSDYSNAIRLNVTYAEAYSNRGVLLMQAGKHEKAVRDFSSAIRYAPGYTGAYLNRAKAYLKLGDNARACADADKACSMGKCGLKSHLSERKKCSGPAAR